MPTWDHNGRKEYSQKCGHLCQERWQDSQGAISIIFLFCFGVVPVVIVCMGIIYGLLMWVMSVYGYFVCLFWCIPLVNLQRHSFNLKLKIVALYLNAHDKRQLASFTILLLWSSKACYQPTARYTSSWKIPLSRHRAHHLTSKCNCRNPGATWEVQCKVIWSHNGCHTPHEELEPANGVLPVL